MFLIFDGNNFLFRSSYHPEANSINVDNIPIGIVRVALYTIRKIITDFDVSKINDIIFCWDGKRDTDSKKELLHRYKENRKFDVYKKNVYQQINLIKDCLYYLGIKQVQSHTTEADDIIGILVGLFSYFKKKSIVISEDKDLLQLVSEYCDIINLKHNRQYTSKNFKNIFKIEPYQYVDYLALVGDVSDNIDGIRGIGKNMAIEILNIFDSCENIFKSKYKILEDINMGGMYSNKVIMALIEIINNMDKINRNIKLIRLGALLNKEEKEEICRDYLKQKNKLDIEGFRNFCQKYYLLDILSNVEDFCEPFMYIRN